ncbi:MAG TPA: cytochrome c [Candidatus Obscuribacterales bacterium]
MPLPRSVPYVALASAILLMAGTGQYLAMEPAKVKKRVIHRQFKPQAATTEAARGKGLFQKNNCGNCHFIGSAGGCLAPPLQGIGARRNRQFILSRITDSPEQIRKFEQLYGQAELMPHPRLRPQQSSAIAAYLLTLKEPKGGFIVENHAAKTEEQTPAQTKAIDREKTKLASIAAGKKLFYENGCSACHSIGGLGGDFGPRLDDVKRRGLNHVRAQITKAELLVLPGSIEYSARGTVMPPSNLAPDEINAVADFLMSLPGTEKKTPSRPR